MTDETYSVERRWAEAKARHPRPAELRVCGDRLVDEVLALRSRLARAEQERDEWKDALVVASPAGVIWLAERDEARRLATHYRDTLVADEWRMMGRFRNQFRLPWEGLPSVPSETTNDVTRGEAAS